MAASMTSPHLRRRKFLQAGATAAASASAISCGTAKNPWRALTLEQARTLEAVCEQIVPADRDPGARQAGVVHFIDLQLNGFHHSYREAYRIGLAGLDETARKLDVAAFADLPWEKQTAVLQALERGELRGEAWKRVAPRQFFEMVVAHTMQGFYGSPRHGGNREAVSWRMLGVPNPPLRGRAQYDFTKQG